MKSTQSIVVCGGTSLASIRQRSMRSQNCRAASANRGSWIGTGRAAWRFGRLGMKSWELYHKPRPHAGKAAAGLIQASGDTLCQ